MPHSYMVLVLPRLGMLAVLGCMCLRRKPRLKQLVVVLVVPTVQASGIRALRQDREIWVSLAGCF